MPERVQEEKMDRQIINKDALTLEQLIPLYGQENEKLKTLDKEVKEYNGNIKKLMKAAGTKEICSEGWKASLSEANRETMNEERLLEIAHNHNLDKIIKTKEYIDYDALESEIYNFRIPEEVLLEIGSCKEVKVVETLRVTQLKEKNNG